MTVQDFADRVLSTKPKSIINDDFVQNLYEQIRSDPNPRSTIKVVHISDAHIDLEYKVGTLAVCNGYLCCREEWGYPEDPSLQAG